MEPDAPPAAVVPDVVGPANPTVGAAPPSAETEYWAERLSKAAVFDVWVPAGTT